MNIPTVLTDILVVLVAAKLAAELAERIGIPAVVGEIVAGVLVGPSVLHLVGNQDEVLRTLGELGVILLLLDVGLEMDLAELGKVGRASMLVATVGVVTPLVLGLGAMELLGNDFKSSLFVAAALTATSVGITARVFGDLRALATTEARIVLGAAVADDVMGLVVLTVVVRLVTEGSVSVLAVMGIVLVAVAFLAVGSVVGVRITGPLFSLVNRLSRSTGTLVALALSFTLAYARLADVAKLAPIVGAFVAGIALTRSDQAGRIRRELAPVGHLFIPVFFLQIGIDAKVESFARGGVLRDAGVLLAVAVVGKLVSPLGAIGSPGDKLLIGLGMLPRGEVGLIFATIGLQNGVLGSDLYAALLLVVLVTTLAAPQLLKVRYNQIRSKTKPGSLAVTAMMPQGGWLVVRDGEVSFAARPADDAGLIVALQAAVRVGRNQPTPELFDWLVNLPAGVLEWDARATDALFDVIERGNARSWRFLDTVGVLDQALPELAEAIRSRDVDPFTLDPLDSHRFVILEQLRRLDPSEPLALEFERLQHIDRLLLALLLAEGLDGQRDPKGASRRIAERLGMDADAVDDVGRLVEDRELLWAAAHRPAGFSEEAVLQLASYLDTPDHSRALYVLTALRGADRDRWELARLRDLYDLIQGVLADDELTGAEARNLVELRRAEALDLAEADPRVRARIANAPRAYLLRQDAPAIARHAALLSRAPSNRSVRVAVTDDVECRWIDATGRDRPGLFATITGVLAQRDLVIVHATLATWPDGAALESFCVRSSEAPDPHALEEAIAAVPRDQLASPSLAEATTSFDDQSSPWHTVCEVEAPDKPGLLHVLATAFAASGIEVLAATVMSNDGVAFDRFELTDHNGRKLDNATKESFCDFVRCGVATGRRRLRQRYVLATAP